VTGNPLKWPSQIITANKKSRTLF